MAKDVAITFHGTSLLLHGDGTLFLPEERLLIVSDLHLEKGAALSSGAPLPYYDTKDTLDRLAWRLTEDRPDKVICLGDSFHTTERAFRMPKDHYDTLHELSQTSRFIWITGNHDSYLPERLPGIVQPGMKIGTLRLCHEADASALMPTISGHYHPKARVRLRARSLSARCFVQTPHDLIMPAFGSYTGGLNIQDKALADFLSPQTVIHLIHDGNTYSVPYQKQLFKNFS